ncbi:RNA recognition motif 2-domain-containing protein [Hypoxylon sp. FL1284]|nr:RNA recognition motif 2-domain-containing protein [Hypoxylon sp. FL1284]
MEPSGIRQMETPYGSSDKMGSQQNRDGRFNPTSPHSSSGATESFKDTPDQTTFSPEERSTRSTTTLGSFTVNPRELTPINYAMKTPQSFDRSNTFYGASRPLDKDPFGISKDTSYKLTQKLSPTASVFSPLPSALTIRGTTPGQGSSDTLSEEMSSQDPVRASRQPSPYDYIHGELSTDSGLSRCMVVCARLGGRMAKADLEFFLSELQQGGVSIIGDKQIHESSNNQVLVHFDNIRDACRIFSNLSTNRSWVVYTISYQEYRRMLDPKATPASAHEAQLYLSLFPHPATAKPDTKQLERTLKEVLQSEGDLFAFKLQDGVKGSIMSAIVEYCDNAMARRAHSKFSNLLVGGFQICVIPYLPDIPSSGTHGVNSDMTPTRPGSTDLSTDFQRISIGRPQSMVPRMTEPMFNPPGRAIVSSDAYSLQQPFGMMPMLYQGLQGQGLQGLQGLPMTAPFMMEQFHSPLPSRINNMGGLLQPTNYSLASSMMPRQSPFFTSDLMTPRQFQHQNRPDGRRQNAIRISRSPYYNANNHHNHVDITRIEGGIDVRTTIMLRNIPNKVDQALLKRIVDDSSWGKYDFMYLRIDFANDCNVGYAFINFVDPLDIVDFVKARGNQRWNCFKSDKVAEISYATIQGKDCLVQKFRNSSVMLEAPHYRPKLFFTLNGPRPDMVGNEEPFPEPDNQSKMKRSCENAEHVGLFTPNAGQHFRDEQRRRRSQFDRGNPRLGDYDYDAPVYPHHPYYSPQ